jgi:TonB family protein
VDDSLETRVRPLGRGTFVGGVALTAAIHGVLFGMVYWTQVKAPPPAETARDLLVTKMVVLGKPREKFWLPRIVEPPPPPKEPPPTIKVTDNVEAPPAPPPPPREAPKPEDKDIKKDLKRALDRARAMARNMAEEPPEGSLTGSAQGTATEASEGDAYATSVMEAIRKHWNVPQGMSLGAVMNLETDVRIKIDDAGGIGDARKVKSSGSDLFDDSCVQAVQSTGRVPPPPPALRSMYRRGVLITCDGKQLAQ